MTSRKLPLVAALTLVTTFLAPLSMASAATQTPSGWPPCQSALDKIQGAMIQPLFEDAATAMIEAGAPRVRANMPSREAIGAGWAIHQIDLITVAQSDCRLEPDALDRFSEASVRDTVKTAASNDRATCRALLTLIHDGATNSYTRRSMGMASSLRGAAQLRRTLFEDIWPTCPDARDEELVHDVRTATSKDVSTALEAAK